MRLGIDAGDFRRIADTVRNRERTPRTTPQPVRPPAITSTSFVVLTTTVIRPGSGPTPGSGTADLCVFDGTKFAPRSPAVPVTVFNITSTGIKSGAYVGVKLIDGYYFYDVTSCENGA